MNLRKNFIWFLILSLILLAIPAYMPVVNGETGTLNLFPVEDTYVDSCHNFENYGNEEKIVIGEERQVHSDRKCYDVALLKFDISSFPSDIQVQSVKLKLYCEDFSQTPVVFTASHSELNDWNEDELTHFSYYQEISDRVFESRSQEITVYDKNVWYSVDVRGEISRFLGGNLTEVLKIVTGKVVFSSREGENSPYLEVSYEKKYSFITCMVSQDIIQLGEMITTLGEILPGKANEPITLRYQINDTMIERYTITDSQGRYSDSYKVMKEGSWTVTAEWSGTTFFNSASATTAFNVTKREKVEPIKLNMIFYAEKCCCSCYQYYTRLRDALSRIGVFNFTLIRKSEKVQNQLDQLYSKLNVPEKIQGDVVVSFNGSFLFINYVPVGIITDFVNNFLTDYNSLVIRYDSLHESYKIMYENGKIISCSNIDSISECLIETSITSSFFTAFPMIVISGLLDGINPCAFAVLFFFLAFLYTARRKTMKTTKRRIMTIGSIYIAAVYLGYLLIGLAIIQAINITPFPHFLTKATAAIVIILGLINIKDYFWPGKGPSLKIPISQWRTIAKWMHKATIPSTFLVGLMVSVIEFPCTGGIYLAILGMLASQTTFFQGFIYLLIYNVAFVLPLIIILFVSSNKTLLEKMRTQQLSREKQMRLFTGLTMTFIGLYLLLTELI